MDPAGGWKVQHCVNVLRIPSFTFLLECVKFLKKKNTHKIYEIVHIANMKFKVTHSFSILDATLDWSSI